ncbi:very-long-chain (3R)-3-hydroxyacyl-CoA dehydratase-like [Lineus longissimus]|uniref:very-long-chain (3R)-3-hydroxyacyl-CoA dehydratase-like n=1 Tax=Lineus longissimus TaxID=88925 RepID=UPI002B4EA0B0
MAETLSPFVYWGQNSERISLNVALREVQNPEVNLDDDNLSFKAAGHGVQGHNNYAFDIEFYLPVDAKKSKYRVTEKGIEFHIQKAIKESWPRLTYQQKKPAWLKVDFDKFEYDSDLDADSSPEDTAAQKAMFDDIEKDIMKTKESALEDIRSGYLFFYNLFQFVGYSVIMFKLIVRYTKDGDGAKYTALEDVGSQMVICQIVACLEFIHPMVGLVKTGWLAPLMQVFGRNLVLFAVILMNEEIRTKACIWWLFGTWATVELFRYPFYMLSSIKKEWGLITWLRYTVWIPLYPIGFMVEGYVIVTSMPYFEKTRKLSLELPNPYNISFSFVYFMRFYMLLLLGGMYILMMHMYHQRKKKLMPDFLRRQQARARNKGVKGKPVVIKQTIKMD